MKYIYSTTKPVPHQLVSIKYKYSSTCIEDLVIRTPRLESQGVYENKDKTTKALNGYSMVLKIPSSDDNKKFYDLILATRSEVNKGFASPERPIISVKATDYINTHIEVVVAIRIAGVYVASNLETIRLRASEVIVYRKIPRESICSKDSNSIFSKDLGIEPIESEDEDDASE